MKYLAVVAAAMLSLYGCSKDHVQVGGSNNQAIPVYTLSTYNGCTEYRFEDGVVIITTQFVVKDHP